jgi:hypothetical protein
VIESGQLPPDDIIALIERQATLWVRVAAVRQNDEWHETHVEMTSGAPPASWVQRRWTYDEAIFLSCEITGTEGAAWLRAHTATIDAVDVKLPETPEGQRLPWQRRSSQQRYGGFEPLDWPSTTYQLASQPLVTGPGSGSLIGDGPSFVSSAQAVASFFGVSLGPGGSVDAMAPRFQLQDLTGRIEKVLLGSTDIRVHVEGSDLDGMTLELASVSPGPTEALSTDSPHVVTFPLPNGLPPGTWIVLKRSSEWIDRKFINYPNTLNADPGVEVVVEPMTELQALVSGGEGPTVEFKSEIPAPGTKLRHKVCATVAAFANGDGGHILFGVTDGGAIDGLSGVDTQKECDKVADFVRSMVTPVPHFRVNRVSDEGDYGSALDIIVLTVDQGDQPPYGVDPAHPKYYIRRGATTFEASSDQVRALARSRPPADQGYQSPYGIRPF